MSGTWNVKRFTLIHLIAACALVAAVAGWIGQSRARVLELPHPDYVALKTKYGPNRNSYASEEWIARDFFNDKRDGYFVDVGASDYKVTSNTYYLETALNWSGLAIEPQEQFAADYAKYRPRTKFLPFFVSDKSNEMAKMYVLGNNSQSSSGNKPFAERNGDKSQAVEMRTITLTDLLDGQKVTHVDYMSIDIELWEPKALAGFDIDRFRPQLVCIEAHDEVWQQIIDYFTRHKYVVVGKYIHADIGNLYFAPLAE